MDHISSVTKLHKNLMSFLLAYLATDMDSHNTHLWYCLCYLHRLRRWCVVVLWLMLTLHHDWIKTDQWRLMCFGSQCVWKKIGNKSIPGRVNSKQTDPDSRSEPSNREYSKAPHVQRERLGGGEVWGVMWEGYRSERLDCCFCGCGWCSWVY